MYYLQIYCFKMGDKERVFIKESLRKWPVLTMIFYLFTWYSHIYSFNGIVFFQLLFHMFNYELPDFED